MSSTCATLPQPAAGSLSPSPRAIRLRLRFEGRAAKPQADPATLVLTHEIGRRAVPVRKILVAQDLASVSTYFPSRVVPADARNTLSASNELMAPR